VPGGLPAAAAEAAPSRTRQLPEMWRTGAGLVVGLIVLALLSFGLAGLSVGFHDFVLTVLINLILVVGMYIFIGNSGVLSFGHISFMALGAYAAALVSIPTTQKQFLLPHLPHFLAHAQLGTVPSILIGAALAGVIALIVGVPLMRLSGIAASIATLAVLVITNIVLGEWDSLTGGRTALVGVPITTTTGSALVWCALAIIAAWLFQHSRVGLRLRASREDPVAARAAGIGITRERLIAFALSAVVVGVGGALYGHRIGSFAPNDFYFHLTFFLIAMLVVGGIKSLSGAVVGTLTVSVIQEIIGRLENGEGVGPIHLHLRDGVTDSVLAILVLVIMIMRPGGITGGRELVMPSWVTRAFTRRKEPAA
jgi:branched-chain amino acid transport system permease protein